MARPSSMRNSAGRFTVPPGIPGHVTTVFGSKGDTTMQAQVIAAKDVIVHDDAIGIDRKIFAGQQVPPDLVSAYDDAIDGKSVDTGDPERPPATGKGSGEAAWAAYAATLGIDTEGKSKAELVEAVEAHEAAGDADSEPSS